MGGVWLTEWEQRLGSQAHVKARPCCSRTCLCVHTHVHRALSIWEQLVKPGIIRHAAEKHSDSQGSYTLAASRPRARGRGLSHTVPQTLFPTCSHEPHQVLEATLRKQR